MNPTYTRLKLIFLGVFVVAIGGMLTYQIGWVWPAKRCEAAGKWWDPDGRVCAKPVLISDITGRTIQDKQAEAAAKAQIAAAAAKAPAQASNVAAPKVPPKP